MKTMQRPIVERLLDPLARRLTPAAARSVVAFRADPDTQAHIDELAEKCNDGQLTAEERAEYEACVRAIDFITILQSKARQLLAKARRR
jgi:hypothetical protein